ncbi:MAG TPA: rRNA maturation RNase YbeY [Chitinophagaceae bacterium]
MHSKSKVCFFFQEVRVSLASRNILKKYIQSIFKKEGKKLESLNIIFCSDNALLEINRKYLKHDFYTDIITFDLSESAAIKAEIYISIDRVNENSHKLGFSFKSELLRVIFHGVLHLCGFNDKTSSEKKKIRVKEDYYLKNYKLAIHIKI